MDFQTYRKDSYTADEVAEIAARVARIVGYVYDTEGAERGEGDNYSRIDFALDIMEELQRFYEIPEEIKIKLDERTLLMHEYVCQLEETVDRWLGTPDAREPIPD